MNINLNVTPAAITGLPLTLTAKVVPVTPGSNAVTGLVTFYANDYAPAGFLGQVPVSNGQATLANVTLPAGTRWIGAQYEGDSEFSGTNTQVNVTT